MKAGGIGGVEVQPVYPVALDDPATGLRNLTYLSDEFIDALRFAADKTRELGLRIDLTIGSGWPYRWPAGWRRPRGRQASDRARGGAVAFAARRGAQRRRR